MFQTENEPFSFSAIYSGQFLGGSVEMKIHNCDVFAAPSNFNYVDSTPQFQSICDFIIKLFKHWLYQTTDIWSDVIFQKWVNKTAWIGRVLRPL